MNRMSFEQLCRDTSLALCLEDTNALGQGGRPVAVQGVLFEFAYMDDEPNILILADLGPIAEDKRIEVYESLLSLQLMTWNQPTVRFGLHPLRRSVLLSIASGLDANSNGAWLASVISSMAAQIAEWRTTLLAGKLEEPEGFEAMFGGESHGAGHGLHA